MKFREALPAMPATKPSDQIFVVTAVSDGVVKRILSFGELRQGWHYGEGRNAPSFVVYRALMIYRIMKDLDAETCEAFPTISGAIVISSYYQEEILEIRSKINGLYDLFHEEDDNLILDEEDMSIDMVKAYLQRLSWRPKKLSDSFIPNIIAMNATGSTVPRSRNLMMEHPFSTLNVLSDVVAASAGTLPRIIRHVSRETQQYFFEYQSPQYRPVGR